MGETVGGKSPEVSRVFSKNSLVILEDLTFVEDSGMDSIEVDRVRYVLKLRILTKAIRPVLITLLLRLKDF